MCRFNILILAFAGQLSRRAAILSKVLRRVRSPPNVAWILCERHFVFLFSSSYSSTLKFNISETIDMIPNKIFRGETLVQNIGVAPCWP